MWLNPAVRDWMAQTFWFIGGCALITLAVGVFASVFLFKHDPDDITKPVAQKSHDKDEFKPEANAFGLSGDPPVKPSRRERIKAWMKRFTRRS
jgi:hypothetical protein